MSWERDPLWTKSRLFFERAFQESPDDPLFGLWCSLALELLGRAALASISPALLAESDREHKFLLHAFNRGAEGTTPRSIGAVQVFTLCQTLFEKFSKDDLTAAMAIVNRRNGELHTGEAAFDEYPAKLWLPGFYRACRSLTEGLGESLETLLGVEVANAASEMLDETQKKVRQHVLTLITAHQKVFEGKSLGERQKVAAQSAIETAELVRDRHHKVICPACKCEATVKGETFGPERLIRNEEEIVIRQSVSPRSFSCSACGLKLHGYPQLDAAQLGGQYTRRTTFSPQEYYGLIDPKTDDLLPYIEGYLEDMAQDREYDNE
jgi:hypothetical protein